MKKLLILLVILVIFEIIFGLFMATLWEASKIGKTVTLKNCLDAPIGCLTYSFFENKVHKGYILD